MHPPPLHAMTGSQLLESQDHTCDLSTQTSAFQDLIIDLNLHLLLSFITLNLLIFDVHEFE